MANRYDAQGEDVISLPEEEDAPVAPQNAGSNGDQNLQQAIHLLNHPSKSSMESGADNTEDLPEAYRNKLMKVIEPPEDIHNNPGVLSAKNTAT